MKRSGAMLAEIGAQFCLEGDLVGCERYEGGHINDTYFATYRQNGTARRYVHQRINTRVFTDPHALTDNISRVTNHVRDRLQKRGAADIERRVLQLVPTRDGRDLLVTGSGDHWRTYHYVEGTESRMSVRTPADGYAAARAFGEFTALLSDIEAPLRETIPSFHDTPARVTRLQAAVDRDEAGRAAGAHAEIGLAEALSHLAPALHDFAADASLQRCAAHNDSKITNVLFDRRSGDAICVVDLDTVMPGLALYDAGELIRTACTRAPEDEPDAAAVVVDSELLDAVLRGFIEGAGEVLTHAERGACVLAGRVLAFENGVRFLTDYLEGDVYFRVRRPQQNLDRARAQLTLAQRLAPYEGRCPTSF